MPRAPQPVAETQRRPLATAEDLAAHYGVPVKTIYRWHQRKEGPGRVMFPAGRYLRARWDDIDRHDAEQAKGAAA